MTKKSGDDSLQLKPSIKLHATGVIDGHAHHNSGATCPLPLLYGQFADQSFGILQNGAPVLPVLQRVFTVALTGGFISPLLYYYFVKKKKDGAQSGSREWCVWIVRLLYKAGSRIQKDSTPKLGNYLVDLNRETFAGIKTSIAFANKNFKKDRALGDITSMIISPTMDMELAHIAGYDGQTVYHEENDKLFFYHRKSGKQPEDEGEKVDLHHEIVENKVDKSRVLKFQKWKKQFDDTVIAIAKNPFYLLSMIFYDPRRYRYPSDMMFPESMEYGAWDEVFVNANSRNRVATDSKQGLWAGVKMYPSLGHKPLDELCEYLPEFYNRCNQDHIPILVHCSPGGMVTHDAKYYMEFDLEQGDLSEKRTIARQRQHDKILKITGKSASTADGHPEPGTGSISKLGISYDYFFKNYAHPEAWRPVLENFADLHINLAHFGSNEWLRGPITDWNGRSPSEWINSLVDLTAKYPNVYTDISCLDVSGRLIDSEGKKTDGTFRDTLITMLYWIITKPEYNHLKNKIIFGTDWYLTHLTNGKDSAEYGNY
jgi:predicted TIM-barrel fold metal-dependent hydrolase